MTSFVVVVCFFVKIHNRGVDSGLVVVVVVIANRSVVPMRARSCWLDVRYLLGFFSPQLIVATMMKDMTQSKVMIVLNLIKGNVRA